MSLALDTNNNDDDYNNNNNNSNSSSNNNNRIQRITYLPLSSSPEFTSRFLSHDNLSGKRVKTSASGARDWGSDHCRMIMTERFVL